MEELKITAKNEIEENIHEKILYLKRDIERQFVKLGAFLKLVRDRELYREKGIESFEIYIAQPELSFKRSTVYSMIGIYEDFFEEESNRLDIKNLEEIDFTKLDRIRQFRKENNFSEWIEKARTLSLSDLNAEIREAKGEPEKVYNPKSRMVTLTCPHCGQSFGYTIKD